MFHRVWSALRSTMWFLSFGLLFRNKEAKAPIPAFPLRKETFKSFQPLYDSAIVDSKTTQCNLFQVPLGGTTAGSKSPKTQVDTDMDQGGSLPYPKTYYVTGITVTAAPEASYRDVARILSNSWLRLFVGTRDILVIPTNLASYVANMSEYKFSGPVYSFGDEPIKLLPQQNWRVELNLPNPIEQLSAPVKMQVILHGYFSYTVTYTTKPNGVSDQIFDAPGYNYIQLSD